jgi:hypothetical protein
LMVSLISFYMRTSSLLLILCTVISGCGTEREPMPGDGLSLFRVGLALRQSHNSEGFERRLNSNGFNNLDLNQDGLTDYISVREFGAPPLMQYSLYVALSRDEVVELATIGIQESVSGKARVSIHGNRAVYGQHSYYNTSMRVNDFSLYSYAYRSNRTMYVSPYYLGRQPDDYQPTRTVERTVYLKKAESSSKSSIFKKEEESSLTAKSKAPSPNAGKSNAFFNKVKVSPNSKATNSSVKSSSLGSKNQKSSQKSSSTKNSGWGGKKTTSKKNTASSKPIKKSSNKKKK